MLNTFPFHMILRGQLVRNSARLEFALGVLRYFRNAYHSAAGGFSGTHLCANSTEYTLHTYPFVVGWLLCRAVLVLTEGFVVIYM